MERLDQDATDTSLLFLIIAPFAIHGGAFLLGTLTAMLLLDWQLALVAVIPFPVLFEVIRRTVPKIGSYYERMFRAESELRPVTSDSLREIRVVRPFGQELREVERFAGPSCSAAQLEYPADAIVGTIRLPMELVTELVLVSGWAAGVWMMALD